MLPASWTVLREFGTVAARKAVSERSPQLAKPNIRHAAIKAATPALTIFFSLAIANTPTAPHS
jgi:hypothetical protein